MREIVLDTETTGLDPKSGHRVVEIGCVELLNHVATGETYHCYINPQRPMPAEAERIHGLSDSFLADKPLFAAVAEGFLEFIASAPLIIHNAAFDLGFLNMELKKLARPVIPPDRAIDTVKLARRKFPGAPANLDALCRRFGVDLSVRTKHGALLDSELLAEVYLELVGGRQPGLTLDQAGAKAAAAEGAVPEAVPQSRAARSHAASDAESAAHAAFIENMKNPIWRRQ
jgi:DNA polymerase III subunit epsilon